MMFLPNILDYWLASGISPAINPLRGKPIREGERNQSRV